MQGPGWIPQYYKEEKKEGREGGREGRKKGAGRFVYLNFGEKLGLRVELL
jgi:hypothetical protein